MRFFYTAANYLTGSIPNNLLNSNFITNINMSTNLMTGTLPSSLGNFNSLDQLVVDNNFLYGTIPSSFGNLNQLIVFSVASNQFSGQIPSVISKMILLEQLFLQNNQFTGSLTLLLKSLLSSEIVNIDLADNLFTGSITGVYFLNKKLSTFSASVNCLSGSIPLQICDAKSLSVLALDGITTAENCRVNLFPLFKNKISTYVTKHLINGGVPSCLFSMPSLETLHLSGNGLTGSLPAGPITSSLMDITLSHNTLSGSIPTAFQERAWLSLELAYNRLTGTLVDSFHSMADNGSLYLEVNRLSGTIPSSMVSANTISILNGNLFSCDSSDSSVPPNDPDSKNYNCGSDAANYAIYAWILSSTLILLFLAGLGVYLQKSVIFYSQELHSDAENATAEAVSHDSSNAKNSINLSALSSTLKILFSTLRIYRQALKEKPKHTNLYFLNIYFHRIRQLFYLTTVYCLIVLLPLYVCLSIYYSSYSFKYAWTVSGLMLSGQAPVIALTICLGIFIFLVVVLLKRVVQIVEDHRIKRQGRFSFIIYGSLVGREELYTYASLTVIDICFLGVIDFSYVYIAINYSSAVIIASAFCLAIIRIATNNFMLWYLLPYFRTRMFKGGNILNHIDPVTSAGRGGRAATVSTLSVINTMHETGEESKNDLSSLERSRAATAAPSLTNSTSFFDENYSFWNNSFYKFSTADVSFLERIILFNNIILPVLAILWVSSDCFYNVLFAAPAVTTSYTYTTCPRYFFGGLGGVMCSQSVDTTSYSPPFMYSYQCSSEIVINYVPVYIWMFIFVGLLLPSMKLCLKYFYDHLSADHPYHKWIEVFIPENLKKLTPVRSKENHLLFAKLHISVQINSYLTIMVSFGALFPPLAFIACLSIVFITYYEEHVLGRLLIESTKLGYFWYHEVLEHESDGTADSLNLSFRSMITVACLIYAYLVFDIWGDSYGWKTALIPTFLMIGIIFFLYLVDTFTRKRKRRDYTRRLETIENLFQIQLNDRQNLHLAVDDNTDENSGDGSDPRKRSSTKSSTVQLSILSRKSSGATLPPSRDFVDNEGYLEKIRTNSDAVKRKTVQIIVEQEDGEAKKAAAPLNSPSDV
jgi:hypothetical protein